MGLFLLGMYALGCVGGDGEGVGAGGEELGDGLGGLGVNCVWGDGCEGDEDEAAECHAWVG